MTFLKEERYIFRRVEIEIKEKDCGDPEYHSIAPLGNVSTSSLVWPETSPHHLLPTLLTRNHPVHYSRAIKLFITFHTWALRFHGYYGCICTFQILIHPEVARQLWTQQLVQKWLYRRENSFCNSNGTATKNLDLIVHRQNPVFTNWKIVG